MGDEIAGSRDPAGRCQIFGKPAEIFQGRGIRSVEIDVGRFGKCQTVFDSVQTCIDDESKGEIRIDGGVR